MSRNLSCLSNENKEIIVLLDINGLNHNENLEAFEAGKVWSG